MAVSLATLDASITNTALPNIAAALQVRPAQAIWVINAYQLAVVAALLPFAALADRCGARRVHLGGMAFFVVASLASALAWSLSALVAARALQGLGAAAMMSVNIALVRQIYAPQQLGRGVGLNALVVGVSFALGPTVASTLLALLPWPWLYALNLPLGLLAFAVGYVSLPRSAPRGQPFDAVAALLTALTFAALLGCLASAAQRKPAAAVLALALLALACGRLLLRRQAGHAAPMLPVDLLRRPLFALSVATSMCSFAAQGLAFVSLPFFIEGVLQRGVGADRLPDRAVGHRGGGGGTAGRAAVRALPAGADGRHRAGAAERRAGVAGAADARGLDPGHRAAHGAVRRGLRVVPVAQPECADVGRATRAQRRRQRHGGHGAPRTARASVRRWWRCASAWPVRAGRCGRWGWAPRWPAWRHWPAWPG